MSASKEMPKYRCHKEVWALKIAEVDAFTLRFTDDSYEPIYVGPQFVDKYSPRAGGYLVVYADGYRSYSPAKAFEEGYKLIK